MMTKRVWDYDVCKQDRYLIKESLWDYDEKVYARVFCKNVKKMDNLDNRELSHYIQ